MLLTEFVNFRSSAETVRAQQPTIAIQSRFGVWTSGLLGSSDLRSIELVDHANGSRRAYHRDEIFFGAVVCKDAKAQLFGKRCD